MYRERDLDIVRVYTCIGSLPESLTQGLLVGKLLVGGLGVLDKSIVINR